jgi:hypothetical protein
MHQSLSIACRAWCGRGHPRIFPKECAKYPGPHRSGDNAEIFGQKVSTVAPCETRSSPRACSTYNSAHGDAAFTVPLFDAFKKRIIPQVNGYPFTRRSPSNVLAALRLRTADSGRSN